MNIDITDCLQRWLVPTEKQYIYAKEMVISKSESLK